MERQLSQAVQLTVLLFSRYRKLLASLGIVVVILLVVVLVYTLRTPPAPSPLPNPNGYDDFLKAAAVLKGDVGNASALDHDDLQGLVSTNADTLRLVRLGLSRNCSVPTDSAITNVAGVLTDLAQLKSLARLLAEEGRLSEMEGRNGEAAHSYLDAIRFGNEMSRGGFIIIRLVGVACEAIGDSALVKLVPKLSREEARQVRVELEKIDRTAVTWDEVRRNESRFARYQLGQGFNLATWAVTRWQVWRSHQRAATRDKRIVVHLRLLTAELAVRVYQSDQGRAPADLNELVPKYLQRVPTDPFNGRPLIYGPQRTNWLLYSIGEDGIDDGGKPVARSASGTVTKGDIFYDSPY